MLGLKIGYARVSTQGQDLTAQRNALTALGVTPDRVYVDHGLTGTTRVRPGLREALAACRAGDMLVVTKLDRLARSLPDARDIINELTSRQVKLNLGGSVHDPTDRSAGCCPTCWPWSPSSSPTSSRCARERAWPSPEPPASSAGASPSSARARRCTSSSCSGTAARARPTSPSCSASAAPPSTALSSAPRRRRPALRTAALGPTVRAAVPRRPRPPLTSFLPTLSYGIRTLHDRPEERVTGASPASASSTSARGNRVRSSPISASSTPVRPSVGAGGAARTTPRT
jgi:hypothetical protein